MKRICILLLLYVFYVLPGQAQSMENKTAVAEIDSLLNCARKQDQNPDKALENVLAAQAKTRTTLGKQTPQFAACLYVQGQILSQQGKYEEATPLLLDAITIQAAVLGKEHPEYVQSRSALGALYLSQGDFPNAATQLLEAEAISLRMKRTEDEAFAYLLSSLGKYYRLTGDLAQAETYYLNCIRIRENIFGKTHESCALATQDAAIVFIEKGEYETAKKLLEQAKTILAQTIGTQNTDYTNCITNLSGLNRYTGNFEQAEQLGLEALSIAAAILGKTHPDYSIHLENLANLYMEMGNYEKARTYYEESKDLREAAFGKENYLCGVSLNNLGSYYNAVGDFAQAEQYIAQALAIYEKALGAEHFYTMLAKDHLARTYRSQKKYAAAEPLILEVLELREKFQGSEHPDVARSLVNLAYLKMQLGKFGEAEKLQLRARQIWGKTPGPESLDYFANLRELASSQAGLGRLEDALQTIAESIRLQKTVYFQASKHLTETELAAYFERFSYYFPQHFSYLQKLRPNPGEATARAFDDAVFQKGYLLDQASRVKKFTIQDPNFAAQYNRLGQLQTSLAAEYAKPPSERINIAEMEEECNAIEKTLVAAVAGYGERFQEITWREIQKSLQPGEAAVEFVHFDSLPEVPEQKSIRYTALVLTAGQAYPAFVPLCAEQDIAGQMGAQGPNRMEAVNRLYRFDKKQPGRALYNLLWQPLEKPLNGAKTVYFSPSGLLHRLNPAAIQCENGQVLADRFHLVKLGSTRQLALPGLAVAHSGNAALFGGIEYEADSLLTDQTNSTPAAQLNIASRNATAADSTTLRLRGEKWEYLNWTQTEIETIGLLTEAAEIPTRYHSGLEGSEEAFKKLGSSQPSPRILHLATHGYFFPSPKETAESGTGFQTSEHPMIRSGLILAGGNYAWKNGQPIRPGTDDGILTAYEIAQLDLSQTELVVLSACETGLGDIRGNEGVYGLQRAFKFAGAKYVLMSLWQVSDFQTQELMTAFYYNWLEEGMDIPAAFRSAQAELREKYPDPFLWAGFVLGW